MPQPHTIAVASVHVVHDKAYNLERFHEFIKQAANARAELLVLPEASLQGFLFQFNRGFDKEESLYHWENAESIPGESTNQIAEWAVQYQMYINFGMFERVEHPAYPVLYNSSVLVAPDGQISVYRKIHQPLEEQIYYTAGDTWSIAKTSLGKLGMMICYDQVFPEAARELTLRGAELLTVPSAWAVIDENSHDRYEILGRARALENNRWLIQSNQVGKSDTGDFEYLGYSRIINPDGAVIASTPKGEEGLAIATVTPHKLDPQRGHTRWYLQQRRPDLYRLICDNHQSDTSS